jgi:CheY-like chemotaxis protein
VANEPILIIDDNPLNLKLAKRLLELEGYQVLTASNAQEAIRTLEFFLPRLILMDFQMPTVDGIELTRWVKEDPRFKKVVVLILSSNDQKGDEQRARKAGCDGYLSKPIDTQALPAMVASYLHEGSTK